MKAILNTIVVALLVASVSALECPLGFFAAGNACFGVFDQPDPGITNLQWPDARTLCQDMSQPGWTIDLATFDDTTQLEAVSEAYTAINDGMYPYMWIGVWRQSGAWEYIDGRPLPETSNIWHEGHPHDMNMHVYLNDVTLSSGENSWGRLYAACTSSDVLRRYMCRAFLL